MYSGDGLFAHFDIAFESDLFFGYIFINKVAMMGAKNAIHPLRLPIVGVNKGVVARFVSDIHDVPDDDFSWDRL